MEDKEKVEYLKIKRTRGLFIALSILFLGYIVFQIIMLCI